MIHGYGIKLDGTCFSQNRRFSPVGVCTGYVTFDNASISTLRENSTQWYNLIRVPEPKYDRTILGKSYNRRYMPSTSFPNYYFDLSDINSWGMRGFGGLPPLYELEFTGPRYKNTLAVIPLTQHKFKPISKLKKNRLKYDFLNADPEDIESLLLDPLEFSGVYPYSPDDPDAVKRPAGWMYSNKNVNEPYFTEVNYEDGESPIDRTTALTTQLNYLPFEDPLQVFDSNESLIGQFDGLSFVLFYGEQAYKMPFNDLPEYEGLIPLANPTAQVIGLEINIFLAGSAGIPSPKIGRLRWYLQNDGELADPTYNYFTTLFEQGLPYSYIMPMNFRVRPSQVLLDAPAMLTRNLPLSNLKVMVGA